MKRPERIERTEQAIVTLNGGSSSIKFAAFTWPTEGPPRRLFSGLIDLSVPGKPPEQALVDVQDHLQAAERVLDLLHREIGSIPIGGIGHRVVHGGPHLLAHQLVTPSLLAELSRATPLDQVHLPQEIALIEAMRRRLPDCPQVACFDTAFHRDLPRVAQILPIPRRYFDAGVRRLGFHGLSYTYLMNELRRVAGPAAEGRVILAHLGSGASMSAVRGGRPIDTTMAFTPTAGLVMSTRPGDLDPGLLVYLMRSEKLGADQMDEFISQRCGLVGVSGTSGDMRDLLARRATDLSASEAVEIFCTQARKWIGALAATLGGLDTLVFAGGIGEHAPQVREEICRGLGFLGIALDPGRNDTKMEDEAPHRMISADGAAVTVRVIRTDEEKVIAQAVQEILDQERGNHG